MDIHGIRPELQPSALLEKANEKAALEETKEAVGANHDAPGVDEVDTSAITGLGSNIDEIA